MSALKKLKQFFRGFHKGFKNFGLNISGIINAILLSVVYIIGVGITSIAAKIFGKHFLEHKNPRKGTGKESKVNSYWKKLDLKKRPIEEYYRQF